MELVALVVAAFAGTVAGAAVGIAAVAAYLTVCILGAEELLVWKQLGRLWWIPEQKL